MLVYTYLEMTTNVVISGAPQSHKMCKFMGITVNGTGVTDFTNWHSTQRDGDGDAMVDGITRRGSEDG